ncbi:MAG: hypothetical protein ACR2GQ_09010 [Gemmatimonadota bacterium]
MTPAGERPDASVAVLVEFGHSHDVCLYSQGLILSRAGVRVHLVCAERLAPRLPGIEAVVDRIELLETGRDQVSRRRRLRRARDFVAEMEADLVVLNSAQGAAVRDFLYFGHPTRPRFVGILHRVSRFHGSLTQWLISRKLAGYFVLDDHLLAQIPAGGAPPVASFYPIFFPDLPDPPASGAGEASDHSDTDAARAVLPPPKPEGEIWITIPGSVELKRRDYAALFGLGDALRAHPGVRFVLLGRSDPGRPDGVEIRRGIDATGVPERFHLFDQFVAPDVFQAWLRRSDLIMPLLHPRRPEFAYYGDRRVSFAFHVAAGWKIPLLADACFEESMDYCGNAVFYDATRMGSVLDDLPARLASVRDRAFRDPKWTLEEQSARYLGLIAHG